MVSKPARARGRTVTTLLLGMLMAMLSVMPFGSAAAQDATPEAEPVASALAGLGLPEISVTASDVTYAIAFGPPLMEGWHLVSLTNASAVSATVNFAQVPEERSIGDLSSILFQSFQGAGGELPDWWPNVDFAGGAWAGPGETTQTAIYLTPGTWVAFSTNPISAQPVQSIKVATAEELVTTYGMEPVASPVADAATPVAEGLPSDGTVTIDDGSYAIASAPVAGPQVWAVTNNSAQPSEIILVSVDYDIPPEEAVLWVTTFSAGDIGNAVLINGSGIISPATTAYVAVDLAPGTYVLFSAVPDAAGGIQSSNGLNLVFVVEE
ncbi:MAG TPA: hypothetical protein VEW66_04890 [Thermomicrobiales bacterium]|nr:hypothetical protein [Thermomicrobiales bacterium]